MTTNVMLVAGLAVVVYMATQAVKTIIDLLMGKDEDGVSRRKKNIWLTRLILPALPPFLGLLLGIFVPLRPTFLIDFVNEYITGFSATVAYGAYGAIVGQFSDYIYSKVKAFIQDYRVRS